MSFMEPYSSHKLFPNWIVFYSCPNVLFIEITNYIQKIEKRSSDDTDV